MTPVLYAEVPNEGWYLEGGFDPGQASLDKKLLEFSLKKRESGHSATQIKCPYTGHRWIVREVNGVFRAEGKGFLPRKPMKSQEALLEMATMRDGKPGWVNPDRPRIKVGDTREPRSDPAKGLTIDMAGIEGKVNQVMAGMKI